MSPRWSLFYRLDVLPLFLVLFALLVLVFGAIAVLSSLATQSKGEVGEHLTRLELRKLPPDYRIFSGLTFVDGDHTSQVDLVVLHPTGIFVLEVKFWSGEYRGGPSGDWSGVTPKGRSVTAHNPIQQNLGHVRYLAERLSIPVDWMIPLCVFVQTEFPDGIPDGCVRFEDIRDRILSEVRVRMNNAQVARVRMQLERLGGTTLEKTAHHLERVQAVKSAAVARRRSSRSW